MFENKKDKNNGIHYTRWIASWTRSGGEMPTTKSGMMDDDPFMKWLASENVDPDDANEIREIINTGKLELESSAKKFIKNWQCQDSELLIGIE